MYQLSPHASEAIRSRDLNPLHVCAALEGRRKRTPDYRVRCYDNSSRVIVILDETERYVITAFRAKKSQVKRWLSK